jgi:hypothetical protein
MRDIVSTFRNVSTRSDQCHVGQLAAAVGRNERQLEREWRHLFGWTKHKTLRATLAYGALCKALVDIHNGDKPIAAFRNAGFGTNSCWNANRQAKDYALGTAAACRQRLVLQFDPASIEAALRQGKAEAAAYRACQPRDVGRGTRSSRRSDAA